MHPQMLGLRNHQPVAWVSCDAEQAGRLYGSSIEMGDGGAVTIYNSARRLGL